MKLNTIEIGGKKFPILCDLNVLETIQEEFGTVNEFERALLGLKLVKNEDGTQAYREDGSPKMELVEPSIKAIKIALVEMVNEGIAYTAFNEGKSWEMMEDLELLAICTIPYTELAETLHNEYKRCFETKKSMPREAKRAKKTR